MRHELESEESLCKHFKVSEDTGHSSSYVESTLRSKYGYNELTKEAATPLWKLVLEQFDDALVKILLAAAAVSFALAAFEDSETNINGEFRLELYVEPLVIVVILVLNAMVGVWQESNAEAALEALKDLQPENARVLRDGKLSTIPARELVPGDIVQVRVGDKVPADLRLIHLKTTAMRLEQAQLTGESVSVLKETEALPKTTENVIQAKTNMLFAATVVVNGMGNGIVVNTGMSTEIGKIQASVTEAAEDEESTPLKKKLDAFGDLLSKVILVICIAVWVINIRNFDDPAHGSYLKGCIYYFKIAVALAVAAIPEGLPAVITTCLALGTRKMAKKNAIVRKLPSVETLGCTNVICSDKTGTLTTNEMSCVALVVPSSKASKLARYNVTGHSYSPLDGVIENFSTNGVADSDTCLKTVAAICALCNQSSIEVKDGKFVRVGEPTEASLKVLVEKMGVVDKYDNDDDDLEVLADYCCNHWASQYDVVSTLEFSRDRKSMSVLVKPQKSTRSSNNSNILLVKGAPEGIISRCNRIRLSTGEVVSLTASNKKAIMEHVEDMASSALRCLALATCEEFTSPYECLASYDGSKNHEGHSVLENTSEFAKIESNLIFSGLVGMLDPPRPEIAPMIEVCKTAGIRVIMITGDNKLTAEAIASSVGILEEDGDENVSFTGGEFFKMSEASQLRVLQESEGGLVFSRTEPRHKQLLVKMLKKNGDVVAMTGDGVNDAPALKQADIGIAMGITGTEVAKEASDMVLADDNFATIVSAVEEGRAIYNNMQAFIRYLISSNIGEVAAIFFTAALGFPEGLIPVQLLWVNLVTDGPPATALGFNPPDTDIMKKLPRRADDVLINKWVFFRYMVVGIYVGFACVGVFAYWYMYYDASDDGHTLVTLSQLMNWSECPSWKNFEVSNFDGMDFSKDPCSYFSTGKVTASTLSLSVLVTIEMLNALNALSEDGSLLTMPPWANPYLLLAMIVSFGMHFVILYVDVLASTFSVTPLDFNEWMVVLAFSFPVIIIDEILKLVGRRMSAIELKNRMKKEQ